MPADYLSTAQALSISPSPSPSRETADPPPWVRPRAASSRRLSTPFNRPSNKPLMARTLRTMDKVSRKMWALYLGLTLVQKVAVVVAIVVTNVLGILFLIYSERIFSWLHPYAEGWRALPGGWLILWIMTFFTAFPPMIGYSTCASIGGFIFDFPGGWPIVASASVAGSLAAFLTSRTIFSGYVNRLVGKDHRFVALGQVLRRDGIGMLTMVRFCPLPYSLSNGFLATIPSIQPWAFAASTAFASPKLLVHIFIGSRLARLAEEGEKMSGGGKAINYLSMIIGGTLGLVVGLIIYNRTMARAAELALEDAEQAGIVNSDGTIDYADIENGLLDPEDAAALMDDDDISLWENDGVGAGYRDEDFGAEMTHGAKASDGSTAAGDGKNRITGGK